MFSILNRSLNLGSVCCFLRFKKLKELSTGIFDSSINILVVLWFKLTWTILEIKRCPLAKYSTIATSSFIAEKFYHVKSICFCFEKLCYAFRKFLNKSKEILLNSL